LIPRPAAHTIGCFSKTNAVGKAALHFHPAPKFWDFAPRFAISRQGRKFSKNGYHFWSRARVCWRPLSTIGEAPRSSAEARFKYKKFLAIKNLKISCEPKNLKIKNFVRGMFAPVANARFWPYPSIQKGPIGHHVSLRLRAPFCSATARCDMS
jgi:hypothetical protein